MSELAEDPILDACLEEVLGGHCPPDLTSRILRAHREDALANAPPIAVSFSPRPGAEFRRRVAQERPARVEATRSAGSAWIGSPWIGLAISAAILVAGTSFGLLALRWTDPGVDPGSLAEGGLPPPVETAQGQISQNLEPQSDPNVDSPFAFGEGTNPLAVDPNPTGPRLPNGDAPEIGDLPPLESAPPGWLPSNAQSLSAGSLAERLDFDDIVQRIDLDIRARWQQEGVESAAPLSVTERCQHIFERVLGRLPTARELQEYEAADPSQRDRFVRRLTSSSQHAGDQYAGEFAEHWGDLWAEALIGGKRRVGRADRPALRGFLVSSLRDGQSLAEIVSELLTAEGSSLAGDESNAATNYVLAFYQKDATRLTAHTGRLFLGHRVECSQCHDHPADPELSQSRFWELNSFFRQVRVRKLDTGHALVNASLRGKDQAVFYENAAGEMKAAYPAFPGSGGLPHSGDLEVVNRRALLASHLVNSEMFSRAVANRVWGMLFGFGFTEPVDDMGPHNPASHPVTLTLLAEQFAANDHDLRQMVAWMASSEAFGLGDGSSSAADSPGLGGVALFSRRYSHPQPAARLGELLVAFRRRDADAVGTTAARVAPAGRAVSPGSLSAPTNEDPLASLRFARGSHRGPSHMAELVLRSELSTDSKLSHLFWTLLQRSPTNKELRLAKRLITDTPDESAWLDVWWAIVRSREGAE